MITNATSGAKHEQLICQAITMCRCLMFEYESYVRLVEPYCHGEASSGEHLLRAIQVGGSSHSGRRGHGFVRIHCRVPRAAMSRPRDA
jgi:hypothetical protein